MRVRLAATLVFALFAAAPCLRADDTTIRIDAIATDESGRLANTLTAQDFEVLEDGVPRPISSVQLVTSTGQDHTGKTASRISSRDDEEHEAEGDDARLFAVFLDDYHIAPGEGVERARQSLERFVSSLGPRDLLIVVRPLDSLLNLRLNRDRQAALAAIAAFGGRKGDYLARNDYEAKFIASDPAKIDVARREMVVSALNVLVNHLARLNSRRKTLIVVSEGFGQQAPRRGTAVLPTLDTVVRSANRGSVSIYAVNPAPDAQADLNREGRILQMLASETNGAAMLTAADADRWPALVLKDSTAYYLVSFQGAHTQEVGSFHPVKVQTRRKGIVLRTRTGYWTANAEELMTTRLRAEAAAPKPPPEPPLHVSQVIRPWFGMARGTDGKMRVRFVWEPTPRVPGDRLRQPTPASVEVAALKDGATVFKGTVRRSAGASESSGDVADAATFDVAPGRMRVQMTIRDQTSRLIDVDTRDVIVGTMAGQVALGTVEILRARNAREYKALAIDADAAPVAAREFSRAERLLMRVPAYSEGSAPNVTARLLGRSAASLRDLVVTDGPRSGLYDIDLPLASLANGEYRIEVTVTSPLGRATESLPFRVTP